MAEFRTEYYTPMDRKYHEMAELETARPSTDIEEPIIPISQIGQTVPEHDPVGRHKNIIQGVQAAIRGGTGNLQIVFQTPVESAIGGRPKAYGAEVRQALKEVAMANEVLFTGMEMPTSLTNMSGWDDRRGVVDEAKRQRDLNEVKEMIKFAADVGQGGGVDIVSWEHDRPAFRSKWFEQDKTAQKAFSQFAEQEKKFEQVRFVDQRSGQIIPVPIREGIWVFRDPNTFEELDPLKGQSAVQWDFEDFERFGKYLQDHPEMARELGIKSTDVHGLIKHHFIETQRSIAEAEAGYYRERLRGTNQALKSVNKALETRRDPRTNRALTERELKELEEEKKALLDIQRREIEGIKGQERMAAEQMARMTNWVPMEEYTLKLSKQSYADAGITAMNTQDKMGPKNIKKDLYVGPELGWPQFYGSHPQEFVDMIRGAREVMVKILTNDKEFEGKYKDYGLRAPMSRSEAEEEAKRHIKGTFDTSHMGMWLQNFHPEMPWDKRVKEFTKWYKKQIEALAEINRKEQIIGAIQAVDSAGAGHGHLPAGQGILPVKEAVEILRQKGGFSGYITSEGHEEEKFGEGRITLKTWQHFNAPISSGYGPGPGPAMRWGDIRESYFGRTYSPLFMFGAYAPSNEFKLWSEVPLE
ncbi:MAG: hypothetical protein QXM31_01630 [Candidatus Woesearchaeota archaeon]